VVLQYLRQVVELQDDLAADDHEPARWHFRLDGADYLVQCDGHQWSLIAGAPSTRADVTVTAATESLATFIFAGSDQERQLREPLSDIRIHDD
jgi:hypothetical protein